MPSRTENSDRALPNSRRWRLNSGGQLVDTEADVGAWEIVDEMNRINLNDGTPDTEDVHVRLPIRTPPKSKLAASTVAHINEPSPLDSSSSIGSSPNIHEHPISHSRGSSDDTTTSSARDSVAGNPLLAHPPLKVAPVEAKERPHSFSGGLSSADLRRLQQVGDSDSDRQLQQQQQQQQQWAQNQYREANAEQLSYPSLTNQVHRPLPQQSVQQQVYNYPSPTLQAQQRSEPERDSPQLDYNHQQQLRRNFNLVPVHHGPGMNTAAPPQYVQGRPNNPNQAINYRQNVRAFPPGPSPTALVYPGSHHTSHLSLGNTQQLYEMMLPGPPPHDNHNPAVTRVQQQHNIFRATHHHSASDPSAIRDAATLALLNNNMQTFAPNMFQPGMPTMPLYPNQYYGAQDLAVQQAIAARLQYSTPYNVAAAQNLTGESGSPTSSSSQTGPSANNRKLGLYKTELCRSWEEKGTCRYGTKCQFAHGEDELRTVSRHPKYKTEICKTFWVSGSCPYGKRCCFIHTELSSVTTPGTAGTSENTPPPQADVRERSNSDPDTASSVSLLARISQRSQEPSGTPVDSSATFQFTRPPTGSLRVDTTALDGASMKQNKSAYPSFASNGILLPAPDHIAAKSPAPVTAGPDLGRHNLARMEIVGYPTNKKPTTTSSSNANPRHSFNGSEIDVNFSPPPAPNHSYTLASGEGNQGGQTRVNGHVRSGSAGNWGSFPRSSHLSTAAYPNGASPAGEIMSNSPWSSTELAVGTSRLHEKAWA